MKYWVFDLDGTLIDSHAPYFESLRHVLEDHGSQLTEEDKKEVLRTAVKDRGLFFAKKLGQSRVAGALEIFDRRLYVDQEGIKPFDGIPEVLKRLKAKNRDLAVWTARDLNSATHVLKQTGLDQYFSHYVSGTCVANCKPDPEGLTRIAKRFDCQPSAISMVGDHDNDMLAAKAFGARAIRAVWNAPDSKLECTISDLQFRQVRSLHDWIEHESN